MYCKSCGGQLNDVQAPCPACGHAPGAVLAQPNARAGLAFHLNVLTWLWIAAGAFRVLIPALIVVEFKLYRWEEVPRGLREFLDVLLGPVFWLLVIFLLAWTVATFVAAWGLRHRRPWARLLVIILGTFEMMSFPVGTALGIYTLWVLLPENSTAEYRRMATGHAGSASA